MDKRAIIQQIHAIAVLRLFGDGPWLCDRESGDALSRLACVAKTWEAVERNDGSVRPTMLGRELNINLLDVFMGMLDEWNVPHTLFSNGLIDEEAMETLLYRME